MGCCEMSNKSQPTCIYEVLVHNPLTSSRQIFKIKENKATIHIVDLMNSIFYDKEQGRVLDANFISIYNPDRRDFDYFVQRLLGFQVEDQKNPGLGKMWVPFINGKQHDWNQIVLYNKKINCSNRINRQTLEWKYLKVADTSEPATRTESDREGPNQ